MPISPDSIGPNDKYTKRLVVTKKFPFYYPFRVVECSDIKEECHNENSQSLERTVGPS
jgi:hypothetical protein